MGEALAAADACLAILKPIEMYKTTYPNKVFDYMAAGRPVILAIDGVIRQVVEEANAGIPVPPGDPARVAEAIRFLAHHPQICREMGSNGRKMIEARFSRRSYPIFGSSSAEMPGDGKQWQKNDRSAFFTDGISGTIYRSPGINVEE